MRDGSLQRQGASVPGELVARMEPYQPSNGIEGACFMAEFCDLCTRDAAYRAGTGDSCEIVANTMVYDETDDAYPREWVYGADGYPTCTAFEPARTAAEADAVGTEPERRSAPDTTANSEGGET